MHTQQYLISDQIQREVFVCHSDQLRFHTLLEPGQLVGKMVIYYVAAEIDGVQHLLMRYVCRLYGGLIRDLEKREDYR